MNAAAGAWLNTARVCVMIRLTNAKAQHLLGSCFDTFGRFFGALTLSLFCRFAFCHAFRQASQHEFRGLKPTFSLTRCPFRFGGCLCRFFYFFLHCSFLLLVWIERFFLHVGQCVGTRRRNGGVDLILAEDLLRTVEAFFFASCLPFVGFVSVDFFVFA